MIRRLLVALAFLTVSVALPAQSAGAALSCADPVVLTSHQGGVDFPPHYRVNQDVWSGQGSQKMRVCNEHDWKAVAKQSGEPASGVKTYPASERKHTDWSTCSSQPPLNSFTKFKSTYSHISPPASTNASFNWAYDLFIGSGACDRPLTELMIFTEIVNVDTPTAQLHKTIDGVAYDIYYKQFTTALLSERVYHRPAATISPSLAGGYYIQMRLVEQDTAGSVNFLKVNKYLKNQGLLVMSDTLLFARYGVEVLTTRGVNVPFYLNGFSVSDAF